MNRQQKRKRIESTNEDNKRQLRPRVAKQVKLEAVKPNKKQKLAKSPRKSVNTVKEVVDGSVPTQSESCSSNKLDDLYKELPFELYCVIAALETDKLDGLGSTPSTESGQFDANPDQIDQTVLSPNKSSNKKHPIGQEQLNRTRKLLGDLSKCEDDTTSQSSQLPEIEHPIECDESEKLAEPLIEPGQLIDPPIECDEPVQFVESQIDQNQANQFINQFSSGDEISIEPEQFIRPRAEPRQLVEIPIDQNQTNQSSQLSNSEPPNERDELGQLVNPSRITVQSVDLPIEPRQLVEPPIESKQLSDSPTETQQLAELQTERNELKQLVEPQIESSQLSNTEPSIEHHEPGQLVNPPSISVQFDDTKIEPILVDSPIKSKQLVEPPIDQNQVRQLPNTDPLIERDEPRQLIDTLIDQIQENQSSQLSNTEPPIERDPLVQLIDSPIERNERKQLVKPQIGQNQAIQSSQMPNTESLIERDEPGQLVNPPSLPVQSVDLPTKPIKLAEPPIDQNQANQSSKLSNTKPPIERDASVQFVDPPTEPTRQLVEPPIESKQLFNCPIEPRQLVKPPIESKQLTNPLTEPRKMVESPIDQNQANQSSQLFNTKPQIKRVAPLQSVDLPTEPRPLVEPLIKSKQLVGSQIDQNQVSQSSQLTNTQHPIERDEPRQFVDPQTEPTRQLVEPPIESKQLIDPRNEPKQSVNPQTEPRQLIDTLIDQIEANQSSQLPSTDPLFERDKPVQLIDSTIEPKQLVDPPTEPKQLVDPPIEPKQLVEPPIDQNQAIQSIQLSNTEPPIERDAPRQFEPKQLVDPPTEPRQSVDSPIERDEPRQLIDTMIDQIEANQSSQLPNTDPPIERDEPKQSVDLPTEPKQSVNPPIEPVQLVEPPIEATQSGNDPKERQTTQVGPPKYHRYINTFSSCHTDSESTRDSNPSYGFSLIIQVPVSSLTTIHFPASVCSYLMDRYAKQLDHNQQFFDQFARKMKQKSNTHLDPTVLSLPIEQVDTYALIRYSVRMTIQFGATVSRILKLSLLTIPRCIGDLFPVTECFDKDSLDTIISYEQVRKAAAERVPLYFPQPKELPEKGTSRNNVTKKIS